MVGALKELPPRITRAAVIRDFAITAGIGQWGAIQTAAASLGVDVSPVNLHDKPEMSKPLRPCAHREWRFNCDGRPARGALS